MDKHSLTHSLTRLIGKFSFLIPLLFLTVLPSCLPLLTGAGLIVASGGGDDGGGGGTPALPRASVIYMWVSSTTTNGNIGGVNGADTICETDAANANLPAGFGYTHKAVISINTYDASSIIDSSDTRDIQRPDGTAIASNYAAFFTVGTALTNSIGTSSNRFWTGHFINSSNTFVPNPTGPNSCNFWTSTSNFGRQGEQNTTNNARLSVSSSNGCQNPRFILCISY